jgi:hypothetical protein
LGLELRERPSTGPLDHESPPRFAIEKELEAGVLVGGVVLDEDLDLVEGILSDSSSPTSARAFSTPVAARQTSTRASVDALARPTVRFAAQSAAMR